MDSKLATAVHDFIPYPVYKVLHPDVHKKTTRDIDNDAVGARKS